MILKETLRGIIQSQKRDMASLEEGIAREKSREIHMQPGFALVVAGIRRCGKSTLLRQALKQAKNGYYFNFEDPRAVDFEITDFQKLDELFKDEFGENHAYFFDEAQNVPQWDRFIRHLLDRNKKVMITGSNASLLSKDLGTRLTGRHLQYELFPFSYSEYLLFNREKAGIRTFEDYLDRGGFPEYLKLKNNQVLQELLNDIITRDVIARHSLRRTAAVKSMVLYLLTNVGKEFSYKNLQVMFNLGSVNSAISFVSYFEDSYLLFTVPKFDYSLKKQIVNPKKVYSVDHGLTRVNSASFSQDRGKALENIVFIHLRKKYPHIFYHREKRECDFVIKEGTAIRQAYQVCFELNEDNKGREIEGLLEALKKFKLDTGVILTYTQQDAIEMEGKNIRIIPVWKWLLGLVSHDSIHPQDN